MKWLLDTGKALALACLRRKVVTGRPVCSTPCYAQDLVQPVKKPFVLRFPSDASLKP